MATLFEFDGDRGGVWEGLDSFFFGLDDDPANDLFGDVTGSLSDSAQGGNDILVGGDNSTNRLDGDSGGSFVGLIGDARGGNDILIGGGNSTNELYGDARGPMTDGAPQGGNDILIGGNNSTNRLFGDAATMLTNARGGNDVLTGGADSINFLIGDASVMEDATHGGDDILVGGARSTNSLIGDAALMSATARAGDDRLISGTGTDHMWGDAQIAGEGSQGGADSFVFGRKNGTDYIYDFEQGKDAIDLSALDLYLRKGSTKTGFDALDSNANGVLDDGDKYVGVADGNTVIDLGAAQLGTSGVNLVTVMGTTGLNEADFLL
jgi:hypothetical protein